MNACAIIVYAIDILNRRPKGAAAGQTLENGKNGRLWMLENADFDEKCVKFFWFLLSLELHSISKQLSKFVEKQGLTETRKIWHIFRQNLRFQASKVSIFAIFQGLPGGGALRAPI